MLKTSSNRKKKAVKKKIFIAGIILFCLFVIAFYFIVIHHTMARHKIVEGHNVEDIYKYIKPNEFNEKTLVVFDIDNTLLYPKTIIGSEQWFYAAVAAFEAQGMTTQEAINAILPQSFEILEYIPMDLVEPVAVDVINDLQKRGVATIALTARSVDLTYRTIDQLASLGIQFNGVGPGQCPIIYGAGKPAIYIQGMLFCGNHNKGEVLAQWLVQINYQPNKIIFIDDKMKSVATVEKALPKKYPFIGIRYGYLDSHKSNISPETIKKELHDFAQQYPEARPLTPMPETP